MMSCLKGHRGPHGTWPTRGLAVGYQSLPEGGGHTLDLGSGTLEHSTQFLPHCQDKRQLRIQVLRVCGWKADTRLGPGSHLCALTLKQIRSLPPVQYPAQGMAQNGSGICFVLPCAHILGLLVFLQQQLAVLQMPVAHFIQKDMRITLS